MLGKAKEIGNKQSLPCDRDYSKMSYGLLEKEKKGLDKLGKKGRIVLTVIASLFVGVANGLFGGGGGMLVIPIFTILLGLEEKLAHSSAILTILPLSLVSGIVYIVQGNFKIPDGLWVGGGVILGGLIGTFLMKKLSNNALKIVFYTLMIVAGVSTLIKNLG
ncbi:MAG: sulfite exporter TauE/SafE family protein [Clostridia bacterium]|nr:sulfite exporter TauE/SafE family protein [Clostridia bacterium]